MPIRAGDSAPGNQRNEIRDELRHVPAGFVLLRHADNLLFCDSPLLHLESPFVASSYRAEGPHYNLQNLERIAGGKRYPKCASQCTQEIRRSASTPVES